MRAAWSTGRSTSTTTAVGRPASRDATDALVDTQLTAADGTYTTAALAPGTYYVCEVGQTAWVETYPKSTTTDSTSCTAKDGGRGWKVVITCGSEGYRQGLRQHAAVPHHGQLLLRMRSCSVVATRRR